MKKLDTFILNSVVLFLLLPIVLNAHLETKRTKPETSRATSPIPIDILPVFDTFQADLIWISLLLSYGENKRLGIHEPEAILSAGKRLAIRDPLFYQNYEHVPALYFGPRSLVDLEEIKAVSHFQSEGAAHFNTDSALLLSAAMNFVGYGATLTERERLAGYEIAAAYLKNAIIRSPENSELFAVLAWFNSRISSLSPNPKFELDHLSAVLSYSSNERLKRRLMEALGIRSNFVLVQSSKKYDYLPAGVADLFTNAIHVNH